MHRPLVRKSESALQIVYGGGGDDRWRDRIILQHAWVQLYVHSEQCNESRLTVYQRHSY